MKKDHVNILARMIVINRCFFTIKHRTLYKQTTNKNLFMFQLVLYSTRNVFFRDSKFISSLEKWISRDLMNNVIDDFLSRWHLKNFIKNDKNEITFNDCLEHFHKMKIRECHIAKQSFARIFDRYRSTRAWNLQSAMSNRLTLTSQNDSWIDVVIDSKRICINVERMSSVLKSSMKYRDKTWYYRVKRDRNSLSRFFISNFVSINSIFFVTANWSFVKIKILSICRSISSNSL